MAVETQAPPDEQTRAEKLAIVAAEQIDAADTSSAANPLPAATRAEAIVRLAGWLAQSPASGILETQRGERQFQQYRSTRTNGLRSSGALGLIAPWQVHSAGLCE